jgi:hypothetical protein
VLLLCSAIVLVLISRIPLKIVLRSVKAIMFIMLFTAVLNVFWTKGKADELLLSWRFINIYSSGLYNAAFIVVRIVSMIIGTSIFLTYTTTPIQLTDALERLLSPLKVIKVPVHEFAMMMTIALRFIPTIVEETGKILYVDRWYLIVDLWGGVYVYENMDESRPEVALEAIELTGVEEITKPFLTILDFDGKMFKVSSHDYDKDAASDFEVWKFAAAEDIQFTSVSVTVEDGARKVESKTLTSADIENVGEFYTVGFFAIDREGKVKSVVFYGELIIG